MANLWWHDFAPSFSFVVLFTFLGILAYGFIGGWRSVKVRPRRFRADGEVYEDEPRYVSKISKDLRYRYRFAYRRISIYSDSTITFCGDIVDIFWTIAAGALFAVVFCNEHWDGLVQYGINNLDASDSAAWGDFGAGFITAMISLCVAGIFFGLRRAGRWAHATRLMSEYIYKLRVRPLVYQTPSIRFIAEHTAWAIAKTWEEHKEAKAEKSQIIPLEQHIKNAEKKLEERAQ